MPYRLSNDARMDLARIYWRGVEEFGELQAERYYEALIQRFDDIVEAPYKYKWLIMSAKATGAVFAAWIVSTIG